MIIEGYPNTVINKGIDVEIHFMLHSSWLWWIHRMIWYIDTYVQNDVSFIHRALEGWKEKKTHYLITYPHRIRMLTQKHKFNMLIHTFMSNYISSYLSHLHLRMQPAIRTSNLFIYHPLVELLNNSCVNIWNNNKPFYWFLILFIFRSTKNETN